MKRGDGRAWDELRPVKITPGFQSFAEGSALIEIGKTQVLCSASVQESLPRFITREDEDSGWITAEYAMLPRATLTRSNRDSVRGQISGRNHEISRIIGRSLRGITDLPSLGRRSMFVDCDVIQADGGTRTAAITGSYVALHLAMETLVDMGIIPTVPLKYKIAAISVGICHGNRLLDFCYDEDRQASVDFNVVMTDAGEFVEIQGTAEGKPYSKEEMDALLSLADKGIRELFEYQEAAIKMPRKR